MLVAVDQSLANRNHHCGTGVAIFVTQRDLIHLIRISAADYGDTTETKTASQNGEAGKIVTLSVVVST